MIGTGIFVACGRGVGAAGTRARPRQPDDRGGAHRDRRDGRSPLLQERLLPGDPHRCAICAEASRQLPARGSRWFSATSRHRVRRGALSGRRTQADGGRRPRRRDRLLLVRLSKRLPRLPPHGGGRRRPRMPPRQGSSTSRRGLSRGHHLHLLRSDPSRSRPGDALDCRALAAAAFPLPPSIRASGQPWQYMPLIH